MMRDFIEELRDLSVAEWPLASRPVQCVVIAVVVLIWGVLGEVIFFSDIERALLELEKDHRQDIQKIDAVQAKIDAYAIENLAKADQKARWQALKDQWGGHEQPVALMADFHHRAERFGLSSNFSPLDANLNPSSSIPMPLVGLDGLAGLRYEVQLEGPLTSILSWFDELMRPNGAGQLWFEHWSLSPNPLSDQFQLTARLVWLGWLGTQVNANASQKIALAAPWPSVGAQPFGLGLQDPNWWRGLPIERLTMAGLGQINQSPFAWVLDPTGQLRSLRVDMLLDQGRWRVDEIGDEGVWLVNADNAGNQLLAWP